MDTLKYLLFEKTKAKYELLQRLNEEQNSGRFKLDDLIQQTKAEFKTLWELIDFSNLRFEYEDWKRKTRDKENKTFVVANTSLLPNLKAFIEAAKKTIDEVERFGIVPNTELNKSKNNVLVLEQTYQIVDMLFSKSEVSIIKVEENANQKNSISV